MIEFPLNEKLQMLPTDFCQHGIYYGKNITRRYTSDGDKIHDFNELLRPTFTSDYLQYFYPRFTEAENAHLLKLTQSNEQFNGTLKEIDERISDKIFDGSYVVRFFVKEDENGTRRCDCTVWNKRGIVPHDTLSDTLTLYSMIGETDDDKDYDYNRIGNQTRSVISFNRSLLEEPTYTDDELLMQEVDKKVQKLLARTGNPNALPHLFQTILDTKPALPDDLKCAINNYLKAPESQSCSRLLITKDCDIILPDFNNMHIYMGPLPKALYILFLKHPEGIGLFDFQNHEQELFELYKKTSNYSASILRITVSHLVSPINFDVRNTNLTRIKKAFLDQIAPRWAQYYYVGGPHGEAKSILLDSSLITLEI